MKYKTGNFIELDKKIFDEEYQQLSIGAKWLYVWLVNLEARYCNEDRDYFLHTDEELAQELNISLNTLKKYKAKG